MTIEEILAGESKNVEFKENLPEKSIKYMNLIEHWGSGIPRMIDKVKAAGLREPEFIGGEVDLRINIYRGQINDTVDLNRDLKHPNSAGKVPDSADEMPDNTSKVPDSADEVPDNASEVPNSADKMPDSEQERRIYKYVLENGSITTNKVVELLNVKQRRARVILQSMIEKDWLRKAGAARSTVYLKNTEGR